jgi:outer membrane protein assembly factor BamB
MIISWETKRVIWSWGQGEISGPHDATLLPNGNVLVFDNGLRRKWSRVVEVDPRTNEIEWSYQAPNPKEFYTSARGAAQRLPNGNTLITDSGAGRAFEVTSEGELVWDFVSPNRDADGERSVIVRTRRVQRSEGSEPGFERSD